MRRTKPDYFLKGLVISEGLHKKVNAISYRRYQAFQDGIMYDPVIENDYADLLATYGYASMLEAKRINDASYSRVHRLRDRINKFLTMDKCKFVTLTFKQSVMEHTTVKTRRQYVSRFLKEISKHYVANIDYGIDDRFTHREHYHAIVVTDWIAEEWKHGFYWYETVNFVDRTDLLIARYVSKLTNHAIKDSTRRNYCIYSR